MAKHATAVLFLLAAVVLGNSSAHAFFVLPHQSTSVKLRTPRVIFVSQKDEQEPATKLVDSNSSYQYVPLFDFTEPKTVQSFSRIDDVIMGGVSTSNISSVAVSEDETDRYYASWSGVCRVDGGGFCGTRTLPLQEPLQIQGSDGVYIECRLASDEEPERRVWKISTRTDESRGEELYQAEFRVPKGTASWSRILIPFSNFAKVRGARLVPDAEPLNLSNGIYQIGMTLSKFVLAQNMTAIDNFRPGYFDLHIKTLGVYYPKDATLPVVLKPKAMSELEIRQKRPLLLKLLFPLTRVFFSEAARRRRAAMNLLRDRGFSRLRAILFGIQVRSAKVGPLVAALQAAGILGIDVFRGVLSTLLRFVFIYPLRLVFFIKKAVKKERGEANQTAA